ncbi:MAG TPA: DNA-directed RNA polymerase subunit alpha [Candidatus Magasanikbacteria bacterium]|nr:DNA-directed RNA polymerase subunit alpha [Candidatus Magasanikbacteria bacterium]
MENLLLPSKVEFKEGEQGNIGVVTVSPCYYGYGTTLGNALRRVLLSSLPGAAVESFKIKGIQHEFSTMEGMKEDAVEVMLNLKQLVVKVYSEEPVTLSLTKKGPGEVKAGDFEKNSAVEIINSDLVIANLTSNKTFEMEITVGVGRGFRTVEEKDKQAVDLGTILIDSIYTPVKDVGYHVEYTRVGDITNYEKLTLTIETNGSISPKYAIQQANDILMEHFRIVASGIKTEEEMMREPEISAEKEIEGIDEEDTIKTKKGEEKVAKKVKKVSKKSK